MDPSELDSLLSMMALDDLSEALDSIQAARAAGWMDEETAVVWEKRIAAWVEHRNREN